MSAKHVLALSALVLALGLTACGGRNIHRELSEDERVLVRKWTLATHGPFDAGDFGTEYSNPILVDNTLIFGNRSKGLVALYPQIMEVRWVLPIEGGVVSEVTVDSGRAYFAGGDGFLYSVELENGQVAWRYDVRNPHLSRPTVNGGRLFVTTTDDTVYAFDAGTGKWLWHYPRRSTLTASILGASEPLVDGQDLYVGLSDGFLVCLNAQDGGLKWERKIQEGRRFMDVDAHPVLRDGVIYIPSYDGALYALKRETGVILWKFDAGGSKNIVIEGDRIYLPSSDGYIYALDRLSAKQLWKFELDHGVPTRLVVTEQYIVFGSSYQYLYAIQKRDGKGVYRYNVGYGSGFSGAPAYDPTTRRIYLLSGAGNLFAFQVRNQATRPRLTRGGPDAYEFRSF